uniref:MPL proto-oncogene, thrombopoietin receptor n=1 Tax=Astyanax mexicanus TaxID=7994 RepID=W5KVL2_ASTMX
MGDRLNPLHTHTLPTMLKPDQIEPPTAPSPTPKVKMPSFVTQAPTRSYMCSRVESWVKAAPVHRMDLKLIWTTLLFSLIVRVSCDPHLSEQDVALLAEEENPKCFTTNLKDLTCFWEVPERKSYEFFYMIDGDDEERRCDVEKQRTEDGKILQICFFPPDDVYMFAETVLRVVETQTNKTIYNRTICIEEKILLNPPSPPSLEYTGEVGELLVRWKITKISTHETFARPLQYEIRYSSDSSPGKVTLVKSHKSEHRLISLVPGEMCTVQIRLRPKESLKGFWSAWSPSVTAMVPQPADDVDFQCHTPDLHQIQCRWNEGKYGSGIYSLHYRQTNSDWEICDRSNASGIQCVLYGEESTMLEVFLEAELESVNRTFYSGMFRMNNSIKTEAPDGLKEESDAERHCLSWDSPLPLISQHLIYQIRYQLQGESEWKLFTVPSPRTNTCLDVQVGSQYSIQVKAMPNGSLYSGHWSIWSKCLIVQLPLNTGLLFIALIPFSLLIISVILFSFLSRYASKIKQFLWPPVPNLNEVLEGFLKDINAQHWEPKFSLKLCDEDIPSSVVEIMSEGDAQVGKKPSNCFHFPQHGYISGNGNGEYAMEGLELNREYVTLNTGEVLPCLTGNDYVYKVNSSSAQTGDKLCCHCSSFCYISFSTPTTNILNHSYVQAGDDEASIPMLHYTNLEDTSAKLRHNEE